MSGLSRTPGKRVWVNPHRGFESRPLRQNMTPSDAFTWGFLFGAAVSYPSPAPANLTPNPMNRPPTLPVQTAASLLRRRKASAR